MDEKKISDLLQMYRSGALSEKDAISKLSSLPFEDLGFAKIDHLREIRQGFPEVVFCQGKTPAQTAEIAKRLYEKSDASIICTRATSEHFASVKEVLRDAEYCEISRIIKIKRTPSFKSSGTICVVTAGTADLPVAEEAAQVAEILGNDVSRIYDVGVAGIHRLFAKLDEIKRARVVIVVAGMEGALASVIGGLIDRPIVAVPTSVGYGASFGGLSALLTMLNSCASGIGVVNIDNGFGAACLASKIIHNHE